MHLIVASLIWRGGWARATWSCCRMQHHEFIAAALCPEYDLNHFNLRRPSGWLACHTHVQGAQGIPAWGRELLSRWNHRLACWAYAESCSNRICGRRRSIGCSMGSLAHCKALNSSGCIRTPDKPRGGNRDSNSISPVQWFAQFCGMSIEWNKIGRIVLPILDSGISSCIFSQTNAIKSRGSRVMLPFIMLRPKYAATGVPAVGFSFVRGGLEW